jgi:hypothetical protein
MSSAPAVQLCTICDKENATFCSQCRYISHCSKACQKRDWNTHKLLCDSFPTFATFKWPTEDHYHEVLLDLNKAKPEFIWLLCNWNRGDDDARPDYQMPESDTFIGSDNPSKHITMQYNPRLEKNLSNTLVFSGEQRVVYSKYRLR